MAGVKQRHSELLQPFQLKGNMKKTILTFAMSVVCLLVCFAQSGERLPSFKNMYSTATTPSAGTNCIQTLTFGATITGGTFKLAFDGRTTAAITWVGTNATLVSNIDAALEALSTVGTGGVTTTAGTIVNGAGGTVTVTHTGDRAKQVVPAMTVANNSMTGADHALANAITTPGVEADGRIVPKGSLCVALDTGVWYANTGTPPNPTWVKVSSQ
jgi:hypothetical protein